MENYIQANKTYQIRTEQHQGMEHLVVPVVMMVEGVHNGSHGPLLHLATDLGRFPEAWNGIPVVINHPVNEEGQNVSANSPDVIDREIVGRVYNTRMEGSKLKAEAWLDVEKVKRVSMAALAAIRNNDPLDVSVGVFTEEEDKPGHYRGASYESIARNHRPDHLALLPGGVGACSWEAGCGIRNNKQSEKGGGNVMVIKEKVLPEVQNNISEDMLKTLSVTDNEAGYQELTGMVQSKLDAMDDGSKAHYLVEIYDNRFIYKVSSPNNGGKYYQRNYSINTDGEVVFAETPVEVRRDVSFTVLEEKKTPKLKRTIFNDNSNKEVQMEKTKCPDCIAKVDALIANALSKFDEKDRDWLLTQDEPMLDRLVPNEPVVEKAPVVETNAEALQVLKNSLKTAEDFINILPAEMQDQMRSALATHKAQSANMVKTILDNTAEGVWDEATLTGMDSATLVKVFNTIKREEETGTADYSLNGYIGTSTLNVNEENFLLPGNIVIDGKEEK